MSDHAEMISKLREFVTSQFPAAKSRDIGPDDPLLTSGIIDSMGTMEVVMYLESEFQIVMTDEEMLDDNFETLGKMATFVSGKIDSASTSLV